MEALNNDLRKYYKEMAIVHEFDANPEHFIHYKYQSSAELRKMLSAYHDTLGDRSIKYKMNSYGRYFKAICLNSSNF